MEQQSKNEQAQGQATSLEKANVATETATKDAKQTLKAAPMGKCPVNIAMDGEKVQSIRFKEPYNSMPNQFENVLKDLTSTQDNDISIEILNRGILAMPKDKNTGSNINIMLQSLADSAPKDATEAKLCLQSTVLYAQGLTFLYKAEHCTRIDYTEVYMKNAIKLLRLHNETIEALGKYRRGGEQKIVIQHVQVNNGGQAIVGNVHNGGGGGVEKTAR